MACAFKENPAFSPGASANHFGKNKNNNNLKKANAHAAVSRESWRLKEMRVNMVLRRLSPQINP